MGEPSPTLRPPRSGAVVLVGPPGAGKTTFLASLREAFSRLPAAGRGGFVAGAALSKLSTGPFPPPPTTAATTYRFQLTMAPSERADAFEGEGISVEVLDTPGSFLEALAPGAEPRADASAPLVAASRNARCLTLVVDASAPARLRLEGIIQGLLGTGRRRLVRVGAKPVPERESPLDRAPRLELPFERVLVLLTGLDALARRVMRRTGELEGRWRGAPPEDLRELAACRGVPLAGIVESLDVPALVEDRVDSLALLAAALKPGAGMALCGVACGVPAPEGEAVLHGVWPALLYMTTGRVLPPVQPCVDAAPPPPVELPPVELPRGDAPRSSLETR